MSEYVKDILREWNFRDNFYRVIILKVRFKLMYDEEKEHILDYFPDKFAPRSAQIEIINDIEKAIKRGKKYIFVQAPTGVGKSAISVAIGRYFDSAYICTSQKSLQNQYTTEFPEIKRTWGRKNFKCLDLYNYELPDPTKNVSCDVGSCSNENFSCKRKPIKKETDFFAGESAAKGKLYWQSEDRCHYWNNKIAGLNAHTCCHNYKYLITESTYVGDFGKRAVLIADEGHNAESNIIDMVKVDISHNVLGVVGKYVKEPVNFIESDPKASNAERLNSHYKWLQSLQVKLPDVLNHIKREIIDN